MTPRPPAGAPSLRAPLFWGGLLTTAVWRLFLMQRFYGWEESDYGNYAMIRGVLEGNFLHYDMNHMPGYYALGALVLAFIDDTVLAARGVSMLGGLIAWSLSVLLANRLFGLWAAILTGAMLCFQPEFALYTASSLREPVYAAWVLGSLWALLEKRWWLAGTLAAGAFSVRFDAMVSLLPGLGLGLIQGAGTNRVELWRAFVRCFAVPVCAVFAWSAYCQVEFGTWQFWSHSVGVNIETGGSEAGQSVLDRGLAGTKVVMGLSGWLLPWRMGWGLWLCLLVGLASLAWLRSDPRRVLGAYAVGLGGFWLLIGFTAQHEPSHNLYWKWMFPLIPVFMPIAVGNLLLVGDRVRRKWGNYTALAAVGLVLAQALFSYGMETNRQIQRSVEWYLPQLALGRWVEANVPEDQHLVLDNIPERWIRRNVSERKLTSWFDVPSTPGDPKAFAAWIRAEQVRWVLWFREDWTQAPSIAPFLAQGGQFQSEGVLLREVDRDDAYGWIFFQVEVDGNAGLLPAPLPGLGRKGLAEGENLAPAH